MKCEVCGVEASGWGLSDPSNCGDPHPDCPIWGIGQEEYDRLAKELDLWKWFKAELEMPEGMRFLEL